MFQQLRDHIADISLGSFRYSVERSELLTAALPYYQTYMSYSTLTTNQLYTSLEVLAYPFDNMTWIYLGLSIQTGFILAFILQYLHDKSILIRIALGFPRLRTPMMNIIRIFLGQSTVHTPGSNLARFVIISWHIYALIMRTVYQSLLFRLLKLNIYHEPPQTLEELTEQGCQLVMTEAAFDTVYNVPYIAQGIIDVLVLKNSSIEKTFVYVEANSHQKHCQAVVSPRDSLNYHALKERKRVQFYVLPEYIFAQHITMYFSKHSFLINRFNELLLHLRSMGLIDFWAHQCMDTSFLDNTPDNAVAPIKVEDLKGVLLIYTVLLSIAVIVFLAEISIYQIQMKFFGT